MGGATGGMDGAGPAESFAAGTGDPMASLKEPGIPPGASWPQYGPMQGTGKSSQVSQTCAPHSTSKNRQNRQHTDPRHRRLPFLERSTDRNPSGPEAPPARLSEQAPPTLSIIGRPFRPESARADRSRPISPGSPHYVDCSGPLMAREGLSQAQTSRRIRPCRRAAIRAMTGEVKWRDQAPDSTGS